MKNFWIIQMTTYAMLVVIVIIAVEIKLDVADMSRRLDVLNTKIANIYMVEPQEAGESAK